jgi:hypothetical protein
MPARTHLKLWFAMFAVAVAGGLVGWHYANSINHLWQDHIASTWSSSQTAARLVTSSELVSRSGSLAQPIFWVGAQSGSEYELTTSVDGRSFVRYLRAGEVAGVARTSLTVAAYPMTDAYKVTAAAAAGPGAVKVEVPSGIAFYEQSHPQSVYLAFANTSYQVEVFDPTPLAALHLAQSGMVRPVVKLAPATRSANGPVARAVTMSSLTTIAKRSGEQIYWAGKGSGTTEYRGTAAGRVYVRYLPKGVSVGSTKEYLTIATYPARHAYALTRSLSHRATAVALKGLPSGGVAFFLKEHPTSVYLAYPGSNHQIEVFSPNPGAARGLVARGGVTSVR